MHSGCPRRGLRAGGPFEMKRLYLKIFVGFWLVTMACGLTFIALSIMLIDQTVFSQWQHFAVDTVCRYGQIGADRYEAGGPRALALFFQPIVGKALPQLYLLAPDGHPLVQAAGMPDFVRQTARAATVAPRFSLHRFRPWLTASIQSGSGKNYVVTAQLPDGVMAGIRHWRMGHLVRLLAVLIVSGLICYGLARYLTQPLKHLRTAVRQVARGCLSARVAPRYGRRRDELGDLSLDFNRMAARMSDLVQAQKQLIADISHELRSPLARISVALALAQRQCPASPALARIEAEAQNMNRLIGRLLLVSRLEANQTEPVMQSFCLCELITDIARDAQFEASRRGCRVDCRCRPPMQMTADSALIKSAIENVLRNAVKHCPDGDTVKIEAHAADASVEADVMIVVTDPGPGVAAKDLDKIFDPFFRADRARPIGSQGAGLGLAIAGRAVMAHHGRIYARNLSPTGFEVVIELPLDQPSSPGE